MTEVPMNDRALRQKSLVLSDHRNFIPNSASNLTSIPQTAQNKIS